jgi:hypothetical protein
MRIRSLIVLGTLAALAPACRKKEELNVTKEEIPREIAVGNLRTLLPTCAQVYCSLPKDTLNPNEIKEWVVGNDGFEIRPTKAKPIALNYADITQTRLEKSGSKFYVRLYTTVQRDPNKEHFSFLWASEESARSADQLFESLRKK